MITGCYTAIITPFSNEAVDYDGLSKLVDFQIAKIVEKDEVVPRGVEIADDIARLFELLMPLYEASVVFD